MKSNVGLLCLLPDATCTDDGAAAVLVGLLQLQCAHEVIQNDVVVTWSSD